MNQYDVKRLALVLNIQTEVEGMKWRNTQQQMANEALAYSETDFLIKAEELTVLAYKHNEEL